MPQRINHCDRPGRLAIGLVLLVVFGLSRCGVVREPPASTQGSKSTGATTLTIVTSSPLAQGDIAVPYSISLAATGGATPYSWTLASGQLPAGLSLAKSGQISGTPSTTGSSSFTVKATDSSSPAQTATTSLSIKIAGPAVQLIPSSINFGNVPSNGTGNQSVKLTNSGTATLKISQATLTGSAFSMSGLTLPLSLAAGASTYFTVVFSPTATGSFTGNVSLVSNDPNSPTDMSLSGTSHWVTLSWTASTSTVVGYYIYRGTQSGGPYTQLNGTALSATLYTDSEVAPGQTYYYVITAVNSNNVQSTDSNQVTAAVPSK